MANPSQGIGAGLSSAPQKTQRKAKGGILEGDGLRVGSFRRDPCIPRLVISSNLLSFEDFGSNKSVGAPLLPWGDRKGAQAQFSCPDMEEAAGGGMGEIGKAVT